LPIAPPAPELAVALDPDEVALVRPPPDAAPGGAAVSLEQ
jgi:hypothetical protein